MTDTTGGSSALLETPRLLIRRFRTADIPVFAAYRSDPVIARYQAWIAPVSIEAATAKIAEFTGAGVGEPGWFQYAVELKADGHLVGDVGVHLHEDLVHAELGFTIKADRQGNGYAAEAVHAVLDDYFTRRGLQRMAADCDVRNQRSIRLLERMGFQREEEQRTFLNGTWTDGYLYGLPADRWAQTSGAGPGRPSDG